ncbi:MAG: patatin-like phospholipase family protein [Victivallales bacterium]|nr:patatin-like phospholipase family protein [Victivallales bacterium]
MPSSFFDNYAIVFAGGGARGAWQIGVWKAMKEELGLPPPAVVSGTSVGALNAALFSQGNLGKALDVWLSIDTVKVLNGSERRASWWLRQLAESVKEKGLTLGRGFFSLFPALFKLCSGSLCRADGLASLVSHGVTWEEGAFPIPVFICARNRDKGEVEYFSLNDSSYTMEERQRLLRASASIPAIFPEVEVRRQIYTDGGFLKRTFLPFCGCSLKSIDNVPLTPIAEKFPEVRNILVLGLKPEEMTYRDSGDFRDYQIFPMTPGKALGPTWSLLDFSRKHNEDLINAGMEEACLWLGKLAHNATVVPLRRWRKMEAELAKPKSLAQKLRDGLKFWQDYLDKEQDALDKLKDAACMPAYERWCRNNPLPPLPEAANPAAEIAEALGRHGDLCAKAKDDSGDLMKTINELLASVKESNTQEVGLLEKNSARKRKLVDKVHSAIANFATSLPDTLQNLMECQQMQFEQLNILAEVQCRQIERSLIGHLHECRKTGRERCIIWKGGTCPGLPPVPPMFQGDNLNEPNYALEAAMRAPENLIFYSGETLAQALAQGITCEKASAELLAELFVRYALTSDSQCRRIIKQYLTSDEITSFDLLMTQDRSIGELLNGERRFWSSGDNPLSRSCRDALKRRLNRLFDSQGADGCLPLQVTYAEDAPTSVRAWWIPFRIDLETAESAMVDLDGQELHTVDGQTVASRCMSKLGFKAKVTLFARDLGGLRCLPVGLTLALQVAAWSKQEDGLPRLNPFSLLLVGDVDADGRLASLPGGNVLADDWRLGGQSTLLPVSPSDASTVKSPMCKALFRLPTSKLKIETIALETGKRLAEIRDFLREKVEGAVEWSTKYAEDRILSLAKEIHDENVSGTDWSRLEALLEKAKPNRLKRPSAYLWWLLLKCQCYCAGGDTVRARKIKRKADEFARDADGELDRDVVLRVLLSLLEILQDEEDFDALRSEAERVEPLLAQMSDELKLRFYGTLGYANIFGALAKRPGFSSKKAKEDCQRAYRLARETEDNARYANCLFFCQSVIAAESDDAEDAADAEECFLMAESECRRLAREESNVFKRNQRHLMRFRTFVWYRQLLAHGKPLHFQERAEITDILEDEEKDWTTAVIAKCMGALYASQSRGDEATRCFELAFSAMKDMHLNGVTTVILLTIYAEGYRSLGREEWLEAARDIWRRLPEGKFEYSRRLWQDYLANPREDNFPGLGFWY